MAIRQDHIDRIIEAWAREMPGVDTAPMALVGRLLRASRHVERDIEQRLVTFGLNLTEFNILGALRRNGSPYRMAPAELSRSLLLTSGGLTKRLDRLEQDGLIARSPDPNDRRSVLVRLTPEGRNLIEEALSDHLGNEAGLVAPLSPEQRDALTSALRTLLMSYEDGFQPRRRRRPAAGAAASVLVDNE
jgi:DNA-binding MarR family transcriptional regulator